MNKQPVPVGEQAAGACVAVVIGICLAAILVHGLSGGFRSLSTLFGGA